MAYSSVVVLVLLPVISLAMVTSFTNCDQFFINDLHGKVFPTILQDGVPGRYQQICQCLLDQNNKPKYFYATLYDTKYKIPVYSAYEFRPGTTERNGRWNVEPQLDGIQIPCMSTEGSARSQTRGQRQALNCDYDHSAYDRGHLYPVSHTDSTMAMIATFTLTNAAPQEVSFNRGQWKKHEKDVGKDMKKCAKAYVVVGVIPREMNDGQDKIGLDVNVAQYYWRAICCFDQYNRRSSYGYLGPDQNGQVEPFALNDLERELTVFYKQPFSIFQSKC